jgi:hypothetical protein
VSAEARNGVVMMQERLMIRMCIGGPAFAGHRMYAAHQSVAYNV